MDLTINAYNPVQRPTYRPAQRPTFNGNFSEEATGLIIEFGKDDIRRVCSLASDSNKLGNAEELTKIKNHVQSLILAFKKLAKDMHDNITLNIEEVDTYKSRDGMHTYKYPKGGLQAEYELYLPDTQFIKTKVVTSTGLWIHPGKLATFDHILTTLSYPKNDKTAIHTHFLNEIMTIDSHIVNVERRNAMAQKFAEDTDLLEQYEAQKPKMLASSEFLINQHNIQENNERLATMYCAELDKLA